jgi:gamma-glutamyltranspeptidase / glutathione hydrolase
VTRGVITTPHWLATEAGLQVLRDGGNAVDAAIAANAVLCVAYPHMTSLGGDLFALVWPAEAEEPVGLAGAGRSGSLATLEALWERGYREMPERGILPVTVPGTVEAWGRLLETFGTMGLEPLMAPAAALAREGYPVTAKLATFLSREAEWLQMDPETRRLLPSLKDGMALRNPDLAGTLEDIGRNGFNGFYRGEIGHALAEAIRRRDGLVTAEDLAAHRSAWVEPVVLEYRGLTVYEMPPPTQGLAAAAMLKRLEALEPERLRPGLPFARELLRVRDQVYPLRERYITDPDFAEIPWAPFLEPSLSGDALGDAPPVPEGDTVYLCTADEHGNLVSLIQSVAGPFGSGVIAEGTGVLLHNRGKYFSLRPDHVNRLEPRKRTMHTLIPALAARGGRPWAAFGARGADSQPQIQAQVLINLVDRGLDPQEAVAAPRLLVPPGGGGLLVEADYPEAREILRTVPGAVPMPPGSWQMGHAQALVVEGTASWRAGTDPRADGSVGEA